ncbi:hypothetical protein Dsin_024674 [Dipteronia sinensis]|uniref:Plastid lipid-associated protein/fibrillin conserved domain-containing protein n=1 Tax=Dipteronia sinensis TaxID=43782 RepID=A0AAD9ZVI3_9ROSI|nr:hypothetical protein Dsin_024674 [Dipteronia sinensis]
MLVLKLGGLSFSCASGGLAAFGVTATLKSYQVEGVSWLILRFLLGLNRGLGSRQDAVETPLFGYLVIKEYNHYWMVFLVIYPVQLKLVTMLLTRHAKNEEKIWKVEFMMNVNTGKKIKVDEFKAGLATAVVVVVLFLSSLTVFVSAGWSGGGLSKLCLRSQTSAISLLTEIGASAGASVDSTRKNLAAAFVNAGFGQVMRVGTSIAILTKTVILHHTIPNRQNSQFRLQTALIFDCPTQLSALQHQQQQLLLQLHANKLFSAFVVVTLSIAGVEYDKEFIVHPTSDKNSADSIPLDSPHKEATQGLWQRCGFSNILSTSPSFEESVKGFFGVPSTKKSEIERLVQLLESQNPTPDPTLNPDKVGGCWKLVYSTVRILGYKRTKLRLREALKGVSLKVKGNEN